MCIRDSVKIDPKAIGVGQYQHDMPAKRLDEALGGVVEACVNAVGVDLKRILQAVRDRNGAAQRQVVLRVLCRRKLRRGIDPVSYTHLKADADAQPYATKEFTAPQNNDQANG